jgi:hypothetical protein
VLRQKMAPFDRLTRSDALRELLHDADEGMLSFDCQIACNRDPLFAPNCGSCAILVQATKKSRWTKAGSKQIKVCASIHLPLEHLEFRYLAFGLPV